MMGLNPELGEYTANIQLATYDIDANCTLRPSALMRHCQELCELHLACYGLTHSKMAADGIIFVFTRAGLQVNRWPGQHDVITAKTRACGVVGVQFYREFEFSCGDELLAKVLQTSVVVSATEHKLLRPKAFLEYGVGVGTNTGQRLERLSLPKEMALVGERPVRYSDLDYNGHLNNSVYSDIFCDFVPGGMQGRMITDFQIHYALESTEGEVLQIYREQQGNTVLLRGVNPRGLCFECQGVIQKKNTK